MLPSKPYMTIFCHTTLTQKTTQIESFKLVWATSIVSFRRLMQVPFLFYDIVVLILILKMPVGTL